MMSADRLALDDFIPYRLSFTSGLVSDTIARLYEALFRLSIPQWRLIATVAEADGMSQVVIAGRTRMDKVTVSRAAIALVERGLLARELNPEDGRSRLLRLTDAGRSLYEMIVPEALKIERQILAQLDPREVTALVATLRKIDAITAGFPE